MILHAIERGHAHPRGRTEPGEMPLVLLHGLFGRAANFGGVQQRLASFRRVLALDLRNHGASPHAAGMDYATLAADVLETLTALEAWPCVLVGHSMGGKVAMRVALDAPDAVARLLVADVAPVVYPPRFRTYAAAMLGLPLVPGTTRAAADAALSAAVPDARVRAFLLQNFRAGDQPAWTMGLQEVADALPDIGGWPPVDTTYTGPALFLSGELSDYVLPEHRPAIMALFPTARFASLRGAGHWLHADDPDGFVRTVDAFAG